MIRGSRRVLAIALITGSAHASTSIYGAEFDYRKARPAVDSFPGESRSRVDSYCKKKVLSTIDLSVCAQFRYEESIAILDRELAKIKIATRDSDRERKVNVEPEALPFLESAQRSWVMYRDNECYSETYQAGQASLHFVYFWDCMNRITKARLKELTSPDGEE